MELAFERNTKRIDFCSAQVRFSSSWSYPRGSPDFSTRKSIG